VWDVRTGRIGGSEMRVISQDITSDCFEYKSPISMIADDIQTRIVEEEDKMVITAVRDIGIDVDKKELAKALRYDRNQYEKGKIDGLKEFLKRLKEQTEKNGVDNLEYGITYVDLEEIAKEMGVELDE
jgi:hypothetical protein